MIKMYFLFMVMCLSNSDGFSQIDIDLKDYKTIISPKNCSEGRTIKLSDSTFIKIQLLNCKGKMTIQGFDRAGKLSITGQYCESLDTLKEYVAVYNLQMELVKIVVRSYFEPLKDGFWIYYSDNRIIKQENYKQGILVSSESL